MKACRIAIILSCCWIVATGCCICRHPYDDCGPVWSQGACKNCNPDYRSGSVLNRNRPAPPLDEVQQAAKSPKPSPKRQTAVARASDAGGWKPAEQQELSETASRPREIDR